MIKQQDLPVHQLLAEMKRCSKLTNDLQEALVRHARQQEITEIHYNTLVRLAKEGIEFLSNTRLGDYIDERWIAQRDDLAERASSQLQDISL